MNPTFKTTIIKNRVRKDGTCAVFIRIGFKSKYTYVATPYSVGKTELNKKGEIKNGFIVDKCNELIAEYRHLIEFAGDLSHFDVQMVREFIQERKVHQNGLNYSALFRDYMEQNKNSPSKSIHRAAYNHLVKYAGDKILVNDITPNWLLLFEKYLSDKMGSPGVAMYLSQVRTVYNWIIDEYEYKGYKFIYPFRKYKIPAPTYKPNKALSKEQLRAILFTKLKTKEANRMRDAFAISLMTLGTNAKDLYLIEKIGERMEYDRSKTKDRRTDNAFISVKIEPEVRPFIKRNKGVKRAFSFSDVHVSPRRFALSSKRGLDNAREQINKLYGEDFLPEFTFYDARRTMASVMSNKLKISNDDIAKCLNHVDDKNTTTRPYIERDFSVLDRCNRMFIDWLYDKESE